MFPRLLYTSSYKAFISELLEISTTITCILLKELFNFIFSIVFVKELLLGPESERTKYLFSKNTRLLSCFEKDGVLYVNLSEDMLDLGGNVISFEESVKLVTKNIKQNFGGIKSVEIYVDGKSMYDRY